MDKDKIDNFKNGQRQNRQLKKLTTETEMNNGQRR